MDYKYKIQHHAHTMHGTYISPKLALHYSKCNIAKSEADYKTTTCDHLYTLITHLD